MKEQMFLRGGSSAADIARVFGSEALARTLYVSHREEIDGYGGAGWRSAAWWLWAPEASEAPQELRTRPMQAEAADVDDLIADEDEFEAQRVLWLDRQGLLEEWERRDLISKARLNADYPNPYYGPSERQRDIARRLIAALEDR